MSKSEIREVHERLSRTLHEIKSDRLMLKQEITQEVKQESEATLKNIETQMSQMMKLILERPWRALPSTTENNPNEHVNTLC